ncbi:MAG: RHS repeat protein, partial [Coxiellaceae bacterium]|nr:RHS repeat protein [Coxiellaceae bacterium]
REVKESQQGDQQHYLLTTSFAFDGLSRATGKTIDPSAIAIKTTKSLNAAGLPVEVVDPNGNISWHFYDIKGQLCITVDAQGLIIQKTHDAMGSITQQREYKTAFDFKTNPITLKTTLAEIQALIKPMQLPIDQLAYFFYDGIGRVRFTANQRGAVIGFQYNLNGQQHCKMEYATLIDVATLQSTTTAKLTSLMETKTSDDDRMSYKVYDAAGRLAFTIEPVGLSGSFSYDDRGLLVAVSQYAVTQTIYDKKARKIQTIGYADLISDAKTIANLPADQIAEKLTKNPSLDRVNYFVYDAADRLIYSVDPEYAVFQYDHDANGNVTQSVEFAKSIAAPTSYSALVTLLKALVPNVANGDRIIKTSYDHANRKVKVTDALGYVDHYYYDALSHITSHQDRALATWSQGYDTAGRLTSKTAPKTNVTSVTQTGAMLQSSESLLATQTAYTLDAQGNQTQITYAKGTADQRTIQFQFNPHNKPTLITQAAVPVDDPTKPASFAALPVTVAPVSIQMVRDPLNNVLVTIDELGQPLFFVYDAANNKRFQVTANRAVTEWQYNAFNQAIK